MNKAFRILLVVALAATLLPLTYIPVVAAYSQEIAADEEALWPCSDVLPGAGFAEIDAYDVIPDPQMGALNRHFSGEAGVCYAGSVMEYHVGGGTQMKMRIASNELRHLFVASPLEIDNTQVAQFPQVVFEIFSSVRF